MTQLPSKTTRPREATLLPLILSSEPDGGETATTARDKVCNYILQKICTGVYQPGSHINESRISKELEISINPVREAVERLIHIGMIKRIPYKGLFVSGLSLKELQEIYEARKLIEIPIARELAKTITDQQLSQLRASFEIFTENEERRLDEGSRYSDVFSDRTLENPFASDMTAANVSVDENSDKYYILLKADIQFHMLMIKFSGNVTLEKLAEMLIPKAILSYRLHSQLFRDQRLQAIFRKNLNKYKNKIKKYVSHKDLLRALEKRDPKLVEEAMYGHLNSYYYVKKAKIEIFNYVKALNRYSDINNRMEAVDEESLDALLL